MMLDWLHRSILVHDNSVAVVVVADGDYYDVLSVIDVVRVYSIDGHSDAMEIASWIASID